MTRVTWHTAIINGPIYAIRRGHWRAAIIVGRGRNICRIKFADTGNCATRRYEELAGRCVAKNGTDRPTDPVVVGAEV
jgi:hypothetical protein